MGFTFKVVMEVEPYLSAPAPSDDRGQGTVRVPAGRLNSSLKFRAGGRRGDGRGNDRGDALGIQPEVGCRDQGDHWVSPKPRSLLTLATPLSGPQLLPNKSGL